MDYIEITVEDVPELIRLYRETYDEGKEGFTYKGGKPLDLASWAYIIEFFMRNHPDYYSYALKL